MSFNRGIYFFQNKDIPGVLAWGNPKIKYATLLAKWPWDHTVSPDSRHVFLELWLVEPFTAYGDTVYTIRNLSNGKYLASRDGGSIIIDDPIYNTSEYWTITPHPSGYYRIMNKQFGTSIGGQIPNHYYTVLGQNFNERWDVSKPLSCSGTDIDMALNTSLPSPPSGEPIFRRLKGYTHTPGLYLIPSRGIFEEIRRTINPTGYRKQLYDCDDFAFEFKAAVAVWCADKIGIDDIAIFCGVMFESYLDAAGNAVSGHAYNFLLSDDYSQLESFDPQSGNPPIMPSKYVSGRPFLALC